MVPDVSTAVQAEFRALPKAFCTSVNAALVGHFECVRVLVLLLELRQGKGLFAKAALMRLDSGVSEDVPRERVLGAECFFTVARGAR